MEYKIDKDNYVFKSAVRGNTDHGWDIIGHVESTFLKINGEYVFNKEDSIVKNLAGLSKIILP